MRLWIERWEQERSVKDKERSGRPRCTAEEEDERIISLAEERKFITPKQIKNELKVDISAKTVRRRLDEVDLHGRVAKKEYVLEEEDISRRLSFADGYANWTVDDWSYVIFSDETHIEVFGRDRVWVQRPTGTAYEPEYISQHMPHSERVSLWGCFCARGIGQAEIFVGKFDAEKYVDILQHNLIQTALHFYPSGPWWFQQDNAPQHKANVSKAWFHNHGVSLIDFPPYSPDLNPIENLWNIIKQRVERRLVHTVDEVERVLKEEWEAVNTELLAQLVATMPARCQEVHNNRGHKAHY